MVPIFMTKLQYDVMSATLEEVRRLTETLNMIVGFLFSFYALGRVGWWWAVLDYARGIQGRLDDLAVILGGFTGTHEPPASEHDDGWLEPKWQFYRFELLAFILCFKPLSPTFGQIELIDLADMGLLEEYEGQILERSVHKRKVVLKWMAMWIEHHVSDITVRALAMEKLCGLRGWFASLHDMIEQRAPWSLEALLYLVVHLWVLTIPFNSLHGVHDRTVVVESGNFLTAIRCSVGAFFYYSFLTLLETFKHPFSISTDTLKPEVIFQECETSIIDYLTSPVPKCLEPICKDKIYFPPSTPETPEGGREYFEIEPPGLHNFAAPLLK